MKYDVLVQSILNEMKCWKGYKKVGTKKKGNKIVNNCVKIKKTK
jgi:hypothetical protein